MEIIDKNGGIKSDPTLHIERTEQILQ